jgi:hypothetical protein
MGFEVSRGSAGRLLWAFEDSKPFPNGERLLSDRARVSDRGVAAHL